MSADRLPIASGRQTFRAAWRLVRGHPWALVGVIAVLLVGAAARLVPPWVLGRLVDVVDRGSASEGAIYLLGAAILGGALAAAAATGLGVVLGARLFEVALAELRERFFERALALPQGQVERAGVGDLVSRAGDDVDQVSEAAPDLVPSLGAAVFQVAVTLGALAVLDLRFAVVLLVVVPIYALTVRWYLRAAPPLYAAERAATATRAHHVLASLRGLDTVLAYRLTERHSARIATASWEVVRWTMRARTVQNMLSGRLNLAEYVGLATLLVAAFWLVGSGAATIGTATTAVLLLLQLFAPVGMLLHVLDDAQAAAASLARLAGVTELADEAPPSAPRPAAHLDTESTAELRGVSFGYEPSRPVLHEVSLRVAPGERVALIGPSGAGKSTVAALLAGIYRPDRGAVRRPERTVLLAQESHVFAATLAEGLRLGRPSATDAELRDALERVHAGGFLASLPEGLQTPLGHGGHPLTAAEQQLLALARLRLCNPDLAILDEATAEADSADASLLDRAADAATRGRSTIVIAHRLSQAATCDRIVVIDEGRALEEGRHDDLLAADGPYARLWSAWRAPV